ncbi:hypothetical protein N7456_010723 [Penicillium angulare]|uniref:Uncharacterized protein n=1 Tax=Penicillium angulare TaxID=116970 RepID=A0A9W9K7B9_9EURO|nr:hypothetical protein N7456_010723 [Penicillium angulare]
MHIATSLVFWKGGIRIVGESSKEHTSSTSLLKLNRAGHSNSREKGSKGNTEKLHCNEVWSFGEWDLRLMKSGIMMDRAPPIYTLDLLQNPLRENGWWHETFRSFGWNEVI